MLSSGTQAADFIKVLSPTLKAANLSNVLITCCDSDGWSAAKGKASQLISAGVESLVGVMTSHTYTSNFNGPISIKSKVWQTEYSDLNGGWTTAWYSSGGAGDGMTWASIVHNALVNNNCSGYLYWVATQGGGTNEKMIKIEGEKVEISKRVWALAQYSRYIRPGATRIGVSGAPSGTSVSAFVNKDGASVVVPVLNTGSTSQSITVTVKGFEGKSATAWITDTKNDMASTEVTFGADGSLTGTVPGRSFVTYVITK
jgi:O-glycosyl hydrolase